MHLSKSVKQKYFCSDPISVDPIGPQASFGQGMPYVVQLVQSIAHCVGRLSCAYPLC